MQDGSNSSAYAMELLQSCTRPLIFWDADWKHHWLVGDHLLCYLAMLEMWCLVPQTAVLAIFQQIQLKAWNILLQYLYTVNVCGMINKMFRILINTENYAHALRFVVIWFGLVEFCLYWYQFIYIGSISPKSTRSYFTGIRDMISFRENFVYAPSQWEMM